MLQANKIFRQGFIATAMLLSLALAPLAHAESLFHASTTYRGPEPGAPRSLFTPPIAHAVGDLVTINISETASTADKAELKINRTRDLNNSGSTNYNQLVNWLLGKFPFTDKLADKLQGPQLSNNSSSNDITSKAEVSRTSTLKETVTCQVVQILPNGDLMVQGQKTMQMNKERQDLMVTGIVKPYYLNRNNQIDSTQVANLQIVRAGRGVLSRQQNDGIADKIYQFFN